jgi:hypothetical protein
VAFDTLRFSQRLVEAGVSPAQAAGTFGSDIATLKTDVAVSKTDVAELTADLADLKSGMASLEADFTSCAPISAASGAKPWTRWASPSCA